VNYLEVSNLDVYHGAVSALKGVSVKVSEGQIVTVVGANGSGKSTLIKTISGLYRATAGKIMFISKVINDLAPHEIVGQGIVQVPEGRGIFPSLNVFENLLLGAYKRGANNIKRNLEYVCEMFPWLIERKNQAGGSLSGGEQQMLAIARALMAEPRLLSMDEPSLGVAPLIVRQLFEIFTTVNKKGMTILLVEQNAKKALQISDIGYVLNLGKVVMQGPSRTLLENDNVLRGYLLA
jgi:branched-chain amino acid transport system ATP-binding protein